MLPIIPPIIIRENQEISNLDLNKHTYSLLFHLIIDIRGTHLNLELGLLEVEEEVGV